MLYINCSKNFPFKKFMFHYHTRKVAKFDSKHLSSEKIRKRFLDYFISENGHNFVKSSPVVPYCDSTVPFVNAGMNQFKGIFLGTQTPRYRRVANYQKCVRIGGKHNDLDVVGSDGYHHTFFEMLGNWSFNSYSKKEACTYAWNLLTKIYKLPSSRLYVTYFEGDPRLGLSEDTETKEIWKEIGVKEDRILPFGMNDNFWEMGLVGPCGPCTEIHVDNRGTRNRSEFVNKGLHDLIEIWNLVFIEYNRNQDGVIESLPEKHIDTGMGLERLTSVLQGKLSNYDTDNFRYILNAIHKNCSDVPSYSGKFGENDWDNLDSSYRILADHSRTITVSLADGVIPEQNQKLRKVLRKAFVLSESVFKKEQGLVKELSKYVIDYLGKFYPEIEKNFEQVYQIIDYEEEVYKSIRSTASKEWQKIIKNYPKLKDLDVLETPGFVAAFKEINKTKPTEIDKKLAYKLYDTYGLDVDNIHKLSSGLDIRFDEKDFFSELNSVKQKSKRNNLQSINSLISLLSTENKTDDKYKYDYEKLNNKYVFHEVPIRVLQIIKDEDTVDEVNPDEICSILLDKTNLYSEAGGQISDRGSIIFPHGEFEITDLQNINGYILHKGSYRSKYKLKTDMTGVLSIDEDFRLNLMRNHTATHLLNATIKEIKGVTCQKSSKVVDNYLNLDVAVFNSKLTIDEIKTLEERVNKIITSNYDVKISEIDSQELLEYDSIILIPGEIYPESGIRVVEVGDSELNQCISREPCCGTHVLNTSDLEHFSIIGMKSLGRSTSSITAVTGDMAKLAKTTASNVNDKIKKMEKLFYENVDKLDNLENSVVSLRKQLKHNVHDHAIMPIYDRYQFLEKLNTIEKKIKDHVKEKLRDFIEMEMQNVMESSIQTTKSNTQYIIHYLRASMILESVPLQRATRLCPHLPILVIAYTDNMVKARCVVPENLANENFNAEKWLKKSAGVVFQGQVAAAQGENGLLVCNMKAKKINLKDWDVLLNKSLEIAQKYIEENC